jgi:hypothetical protein
MLMKWQIDEMALMKRQVDEIVAKWQVGGLAGL